MDGQSNSLVFAEVLQNAFVFVGVPNEQFALAVAAAEHLGILVKFHAEQLSLHYSKMYAFGVLGVDKARFVVIQIVEVPDLHEPIL